MNFAELESETFTRLAESSSAPVVWSVEEVHRAINSGYAEISEASEWYERVYNFPTLAGRVYYDLRTNLSGELPLALLAVYVPGINRWLSIYSVREFDYMLFRQWERTQGSFAERCILRGAFWFGVQPTPTVDGAPVQVRATALPRPLVYAFDEPGFPVEFHYGIVNYAVYELKALERETAVALSYYADYLADEDGLTAYVEDRQSRDKVYRMGEDQTGRASGRDGMT